VNTDCAGQGSDLAEMIVRNARHYGDVVAFDDATCSVTHGDFLARANAISAALSASGLRSQDRVAVLSSNSVNFALVYGACELSGFILSSVNFRLTSSEVVTTLRASTPGILMFEEAYRDKVEMARADLPGISLFVSIDGPARDWAIDLATFLARGGSRVAEHSARPGDTAYLMFTSGTTGQPKGCMLGHDGVAATARTMATAMGLTSGDRTLLMMPLFHIGAKAIALGQQWVGGTVFLHRQFDPEDVLRTIGREKITVTHMARLRCRPRYSTGRCRYLVQCLNRCMVRPKEPVRCCRSICTSQVPTAGPIPDCIRSDMPSSVAR